MSHTGYATQVHTKIPQPLPYWHDPEWRALLLAVVAEPEDELRWMRCADWLMGIGEDTIAGYAFGEHRLDFSIHRTTSADWYWPNTSGEYTRKELAWTLPIREVGFAQQEVSQAEEEYCGGNDAQSFASACRRIFGELPRNPRSALALRFARS